MSGTQLGDDRWEHRYRHLVEEAEDMLYLLDREGRYVLVNDSMAELTGYAKDELVGSTPELILSEDDLESGENHIHRLLRSNEQDHDTWTVTLRTKEGERIPCELRFSPSHRRTARIRESSEWPAIFESAVVVSRKSTSSLGFFATTFATNSASSWARPI